MGRLGCLRLQGRLMQDRADLLTDGSRRRSFLELAVTLLLLVAVICFFVALVHEARSQISLVTLGLFFFSLAFLVPHLSTLSRLLH